MNVTSSSDSGFHLSDRESGSDSRSGSGTGSITATAETLPVSDVDGDEPVVARTPSQRRRSLLPRIDAPVDFADGRYKLLGEIGRGAMGRVYRAWDTALERIVAIKVTDAKGWDRTEELQRFRREARAAARLRHRGIIAVHDVIVAHGVTSIVMDYIPGKTLRELLSCETLSETQLLEQFFEIASAMEHAHANGTVHRDLKPENVVIDRTGQPLVADFGLARTSQAASDLSGTGEAIGTPFYMSPEQADGLRDEIGPPTDVWSFGAVLYESFCGRPPFVGESSHEILTAIVEGTLERPRSLSPDLSRDLERLILSCLTRAKERRPTMREVARVLRELATPRPDPIARPPSPASSLILPATLVLGALIGVLGTLAVHRLSADPELSEPIVEVDRTPPVIDATAVRRGGGVIEVRGRLADAHPTSFVVVEGHAHPLQPDGTFSADLPASSGTRSIVVMAYDEADNRARVVVVVED